MSPYLFYRNKNERISRLDEEEQCLDLSLKNNQKLNQTFETNASSSSSIVIQNQCFDIMDQPTHHSMLRKNVVTHSKSENLKNKIDMLIISKTKSQDVASSVRKGASPAAQEQEVENIQMIQNEINNMLRGSNKTVPPESPASPPPSEVTENFTKSINYSSAQNPAESPLYLNNHSHTADHVEHLLESMFEESGGTTPKLPPTLPVPFAKLKHSAVTSAGVGKFTSPRNSTDKLSDEAIENILRTPPTPVEDSEDPLAMDDALKRSTNSKNDNKRWKRTSSSSSPIPTTPPHSGRNKRLAKKSSSIDTNESFDDSSNDSNRLQIIDDTLTNRNTESDRLSSSVSSAIPPTTDNNYLNNQNNNSSSNVKLMTNKNQSNNSSCNNNNNTPYRNRSSQFLDQNQQSKFETELSTSEIKNEIKSEPSPIESRSTNSHQTNSNDSRDPIVNGNVSNSGGGGGHEDVVKREHSEVPDVAANESNPINAVENELEKMFAGIVEDASESVGDKKCSTTTTAANNNSNNKRKTIKRARRSSEFFSPSSPEQNSTITHKKKKIKISSNNNSNSNSRNSHKKSNKSSFASSAGSASNNFNKDTSNDSICLNSHTRNKMSPFVRIYGSREAPTSCIIVNSGSAVDVEDLQSSLHHTKKSQFVPSKKMKPSCNNLMPPSRNDVSDHTWHCVFCKKGTNVYGCAGNPLGDLFGPYLISVPDPTFLDGDDFKRRTSRTANGAVENVKKKRTLSMDVDSSKLTSGLVRVLHSPSSNDKSKRDTSSRVQYEIWTHEPCLTWASGVYLVGASLMGLDETVWAALNSTCVKCGENGASVGCVKSKCRGSVHYSCALHIGWYLDPTTFIATCSMHQDKYLSDRYLDSSREESLL